MDLRLTEWERIEASEGGRGAVLHGLYLDDPQVVAALQRAPLGDRLRVSEGRHGLTVQARQHVGVIQFGPIRLRVRPKMETDALWAAVTYALGIDDVLRHAPVDVEMSGEFSDLLVLMLLQASERLWRTGVQRGYRQRSEWLGSPRGRPDVVAFARSGPLTRAALPCRHHAFTADVLENQVVLAGLSMARGMTTRVALRSALHRAHQQWSTVCASLPLSGVLLDEADRARNRLTARYAGVHRLVRLMFERTGLDEDHATGRDTVAGFMWNMALLFEAFVARFLEEHLKGAEVVRQAKLGQLYQVRRGRPGLKAPRPRPDLVLRRRGKVIGVFDTKYRDLWATKLPRDILYQMSVYALGWSEAEGRDVPAVVLYPQVGGGEHPDVEIDLRVAGGRTRRIVLRAVDWAAAAQKVATRDEGGCRGLAATWAF